jgi:hypothetical protein
MYTKVSGSSLYYLTQQVLPMGQHVLGLVKDLQTTVIENSAIVS